MPISVALVLTGIRPNTNAPRRHMKLKTKVGDLLDAFAQTSLTLDKKGVISGNLYVRAEDKTNSQYLYSTNLVSETLIRVPATVEAPGEVLVNPRKIKDGLTGISREHEVSLSLNESKTVMTIKSGKTKFTVTTDPNVALMAGKAKGTLASKPTTITMSASLLAEILSRSIFCIPNDETGQKQALAALKISDSSERTDAYATDGTIAVRISNKRDEGNLGLGKGVLLPSPSLPGLSALLNRKRGEDAKIVLSDTGNKIGFKFGDTFFGSLTMASSFPNLETIFDSKEKHKYSFTIDKESFKQALIRCSSFVSIDKVLELELAPSSITIKANGDDTISDQIDVVYAGEKPTDTIKFGMGLAHMTNIVSSSKSLNITVGATKNDRPLLITDKHIDDDDNELDISYVVMGIRVGNGK